MKTSTPFAWALLGSIALAVCTANARAEAIVVRGEMARFARLVYDHEYRNSNGNVFRNSKQASPSGNAFRSSRHYRQRLAASTDGYPVQTWIRYEETVGNRTRLREERFVYPSRSPRGPVGLGDFGGVPEAGLELLEVGEPEYGADYDDRYDDRYAVGPTSRVVRTYGRPRPQRQRPEPVARPATQRAVVEHVTLPDGRVRTIIRSVPIGGAS